MTSYVNDANAPLPRGHYSQAVKANGFIFVSGQLPLVPGPDILMPAGLDAQVHQVFANIDAILRHSGRGMRNLVSVQIFITNMANWPRVNELYARILGEGPAPARTVVSCPELHYGAEIEVSAIAIALG
ncbi:2-iminobutanoate/2-iminopropanoate deaminase [compost metagenome]